MAQYFLMSDGGVKDTVNNLFIPADEANRHYQEYLAWVAEGNTPDEETPPTLEEVKASKVDELKSMANSILAPTDWYVIRNTETAVSVPSEITSFRDSVRTYTDTAETAINALTDVESVKAYEFSFPTM